jgi:nitrogen regulatory protein P-II 1
LKVEAVMRSEIVKTVVDKLAVAARTGGNGEVGDGKIFVIAVEDAVRIRTGEHGAETVQHAERAMWGH